MKFGGKGGSSHSRQEERSAVGEEASRKESETMPSNTCRSTSAMLRVDEQEGGRAWCREGGEKRRGLTEPKPGRAGDRGTQRRTGEADGVRCLSGGYLPDRSLCDCLMSQGSKGHEGTGQVRTGQDSR